ncbi:MAG: hypothetical protein CMO40_08790 [Verrucomicrobiaceae bacterium]|nr:hypothetical protein [Verrucomicrobiaceae bacterium]
MGKQNLVYHNPQLPTLFQASAIKQRFNIISQKSKIQYLVLTILSDLRAQSLREMLVVPKLEMLFRLLRRRQ